MSDYLAPLRDMRFVMYEVFNGAEQWAQWPATRDLIDRETADAILEESARLASRTIAPLNRSGDEEGCHWQDSSVTTPKGFKEAFNLFAEGSWIGLTGNPEYGGMGMPKMLGAQFDEMLCSASLSFILYPSLTSGACLALETHGSEELKKRYLEKMYSGEWAGTMCLTEAHCGTDLGIIRTRAEPQDDGTYLISGTKIFITGGEHDLTENIIHLVLAKLPDAPVGPKGISMFLVPKRRISEDGSPGDRNNLSCGSIEHKMGIKASATCVMNFDGARGYLIGEVNKGLNAMFTMMNYERLHVGIQGLGCSERSYQTAMAYARDRLQGRAATGAVLKDKPADPLTVHGDVRRMLLTMKAMNEGGRAFSTYVAQQLDILRFSEDECEKQKAEGLVALLTPVVKAFLTDTGFEGCVIGQQVLGGHGYIREWGQEQLVRDARIAQIYEGTNGIQALDLLGRKIVQNKGANFLIFINEVRSTVDQNNPLATPLFETVDKLKTLTERLIEEASKDANTVNAACVDYLNALAYTVYAWMWALMHQAAEANNEDDFYQSKLITAQYFYKRLLPAFDAFVSAAGSGTKELYEIKF